MFLKKYGMHVTIIVSLLLLLGTMLPAYAITTSTGEYSVGVTSKISPTLLKEISSSIEPVEVIVSFTGDSAPTDENVELLTAVGIDKGISLKSLPIIGILATKKQIETLALSGQVRSLHYNERLDYYNEDAGKLTGVQDAKSDQDLRLGGYPVSGKGITVLVNDSGIDGTHLDHKYDNKVIENVLGSTNLHAINKLLPITWKEGIPNTDTNSGHGTHVAGTVAGDGSRSAGKYAGVAPGANLVGYGSGAALFVLDGLGGFDYAITHQFEHGIRIITNSWGSSGAFDPTHPINIASKKAYDRGIIVTFAAGNSGESGNNTLNKYAKAPWVINVGAADKNKELASFSSRGVKGDQHSFIMDGENWLVKNAPTITAPGVNIISTIPPSPIFALGQSDDIDLAHKPFYARLNGTSMATPHVAGIVALLLEVNPTLSPKEIKQILVSTASKMEGRDEWEVGAGFVNAHAAIKAVYDASPVARNQGSAVAYTDELYNLYGRVFPDPQGGLPKGPGVSPYAKGNVAANQFIQFHEAIQGLKYLEKKFPNKLQVYRIDEKLNDEDLLSAGIGTTLSDRERSPLYIVKVTDLTVSEPKKKIVFSLSMHGIERAGIEGGLRAIEDLVSASPYDRLTLESDSSTMAAALEKEEVYFLLTNPDGWKRGDIKQGGLMYQRYNGNGVDINRDWPVEGYTFKPYTPGSEPETKAYMKALKAISEKWDSGADLHGMINANAFTYTMMPAGQIDYFKNKRVLNLVEGIHKDAQKRLSWSPLIVEPTSKLTGTGTVMTGQQWGTVWDTLNYTVTGDFGNWAGNTIGLDADVIDNEMALSHLSNNNIFHPLVEQMHVDGNKGLIFTQMQTELKSWTATEKEFPIIKKVAVMNHGVHVTHSGEGKAKNPYKNFPAQEKIDFSVIYPINSEYHFIVKGPNDQIWSNGMEVTVRGTSAQGVTGIVPNIRIMFNDDHGGWTELARTYDQSPIYLQSGATVSLNEFEPGEYKVIIESDLVVGPSQFVGEINFTKETSFDEPNQVAYDVTNLTFFNELNQYIQEGKQIEEISYENVINGKIDLASFDSIVFANHAFTQGLSIENKTKFVYNINKYVQDGGKIILTDGGLTFLTDLGLVSENDIKVVKKYAGYIQLETYEHAMTQNLNKKGAAGGTNNRRQTYEPVPLGYSINENVSPVWRVSKSAWTKIGGTSLGITDSGWTSLGETTVGKGKIQIIGALLPDPSADFYHPNGLKNYALTWSGYELFTNIINR